MTNRISPLRWFNILILTVVLLSGADATAQIRRSARSVVSGGMVSGERVDSISLMIPDSLLLDSMMVDSLRLLAIDSLGLDSMLVDSLARLLPRDSQGGESLSIPMDGLRGGGGGMPGGVIPGGGAAPAASEIAKSKDGAFFSDSMSLSKMAWTALVLPGYGQIYNKQYWKLPILYGAMGASIALFANETKTYKPLKSEWDELTLTDLDRTDYIDEVQRKMIRSNTLRQLYLGGAVASYIYLMSDAVLNYSSNDVSNIKRATTLAMICPGAGQIYNKQYWKLPFVVGGFATMIYVVDWNNRGYNRFKKAYALRYDYDQNPDDYPDGSADEFGGRYTADYLKSLRKSYRRNRDLCLIMTAGLYILQVIDAHVDAHLHDYDITDDLTMNIEPMIQSNYSPTKGRSSETYGFNFNMTF